MTQAQSSLQQVSEQKRAASAWQKIQEIAGTDDKTKKQYGTLARRLPSLIQSNGLGQTLAFLHAKGEGNREKAHTRIFTHVSDWVKAQMGAEGNADLLAWVIQRDSDDYRRATVEALAYTLWLRRFAEGQGWGDLEEEV